MLDLESNPRRRTRRRRAIQAAVLAVAVAVTVVVIERNADSGPRVFGLRLSPASKDSMRPHPAPTHIAKYEPVEQLTTRPTGYLVSMPWELIAVRDGGRTLVVHFAGGDGVDPGGEYSVGFKVIDKPTSVELIAVSRNDHPDANEGAALVADGLRTVRLSAPITGRQLLHALQRTHGRCT